MMSRQSVSEWFNTEMQRNRNEKATGHYGFKHSSFDLFALVDRDGAIVTSSLKG